MNRVLAVTVFTFRELIRSRLLFIWLVSAIVLCGLSFMISLLSYGSILEIFMDLGLTAMEIAGTLVLLLSLVETYTTEMDHKAIYLHLAKPVTRGEYLLGRILGFYGVIALVVIGMGAVVVGLVVGAGGGQVPGLFYASTVFILLEMFVLTVLGLTFQVIATSMVGLFLYAFLTIFLGHAVGQILWLLNQDIAGWVKTLLKVIFYILPNMEAFNLKDRLYDTTLVLGSSQWMDVLFYTFSYSFVVFLIGWANLEKREFK
jgi:ABC-type transport system involved in multi-copper enzyme maturation permease subunit